MPQLQPLSQDNLYQARRQAVMEKIGSDGIAILQAAPVCRRTHSAEYPYRQQNDFYYLTGFNESHAVLVLVPGHPDGEVILFNRSKNPEYEVWHGRLYGHEIAVEVLGVDKSLPFTDTENVIPTLLRNRKPYALNHDTALMDQVRDWLGDPKGKIAISPLEDILGEMRVIKSAAEMAIMQRAVDIAVEAHITGMKTVKPGMTEYQLAAEYAYVFNKANATPAYTSIVGGGENACILHYCDNSDPLKDGDMVLVDAGAEYQCYASDITRTYPVNGRFTAQQKDVYDIVLHAQENAIKATKPGANFIAIQNQVVRDLTQGLIDLKLLNGGVDELVDTCAYKKYYMHSSGHWMGLDVHDVGQYKINDEPRSYEPGMVLTVEPGLYIPEWRLGIRIEDDVLITPEGNRVLSQALPKTVKDIEACMMSS